jgi:hypothetical protein
VRNPQLIAALLILICLSAMTAGRSQNAHFSSLSKGRAQNAYQTYYNTRFDYSIAYPANLLFPQGEAANGDGQKFLSRNGRAEMLVYGSNNALNRTLRQIFQEKTGNSSKHPNRVITYQVLRRNWFVVSGTENGRVFYQKSLLRNGVFKTFQIEYDENERELFNPVTTKVAASFKG